MRTAIFFYCHDGFLLVAALIISINIKHWHLRLVLHRCGAVRSRYVVLRIQTLFTRKNSRIHVLPFIKRREIRLTSCCLLTFGSDKYNASSPSIIIRWKAGCSSSCEWRFASSTITAIRSTVASMFA